MKSRIIILSIGVVASLLLASFTIEPAMMDSWFGRKKAMKYEINEATKPNLTIKQGLVCQGKQTVKVKRGRRTIAVVELDEPVMVAQADKPEKWGFFQFPAIYKNDEGNLIVSWQMGEDSFKATNIGDGRMVSYDEGKTWQPLVDDYFRKQSNRVELKNGDIIQVNTPAAMPVSQYTNFPKSVAKETENGLTFYKVSDLPEDMRGMYLRRRYTKRQTSKRFHANLDDPGLLRYAQEGLVPIYWLGRIRELEDGSLVAGVYPAYYQNENGQVLNSGISFYKSWDEGQNWTIWGKIPFITGDAEEPEVYDSKEEGFSEPSYEILNDSTYFCVMRTGFFTPVYKSYSYDAGKNWTKPEAFTSNGVFPRLLKLDEGTMIMASGRPGVQLRFNIDGDGRNWTEPVEMLPFVDENGDFPKRIRDWETCGYANMMAADDNTFYLVYSDFRTKDKNGEERKAIMCRKITVKRK